MFLRFIPTPASNRWELGSISIHYYALCILAGIFLALFVGSRRWVSYGGVTAELYDLAIYVIPAGIIGGRLYHVTTTPELYFGANGHLGNAFRIWEGGMGIWGAVALGTLAAYIYIKVKPIGISFPRALDALAPGLLLAQAVGRWGNWFNGELFGRPTKAFWALQVPPVDRPPGFTQFATFHPTFLYESLWCLCAALFILYFPKVRLLRPGNTFVLYIALYCLGRAGVEAIRIDFAHTIFGLRLNVWVSFIGLVSSIVYLVFTELGENLDSGLGRIAE